MVGLPLSSSLPAKIELASRLRHLLDTLRNCEEATLGDEPFTLWLALWRALARQQVDNSLEGEWFNLMNFAAGEGSRPEQRTLLLEAWRGLLRIPPAATAEENGEVIDFERIERGLLTLQATLAPQEGGMTLLRYAI